MDLYTELQNQNEDFNKEAKRKTLVLGGGTFNHVRSHMSLSAPAFGNTAIYINDSLSKSNSI